MAEHNFSINDEIDLIKNTINFLKDIVGKMEPVVIRSNVYSTYAMGEIETIEYGDNGELVWSKTVKDTSMDPVNDIYRINSTPTNPVTYDQILSILDRILDQIRIVDNSDLCSGGTCVGFKYDEPTGEYQIQWRSAF